MPDTATASPLTGPGALFSDDVGEFRGELVRRGLLEDYRKHARTMLDPDLWRQQVAEDLFLGDLGAPKKAIQNGEARIWFAAQHNLDPTNDDEVRGKMRGLATVESRRRNVAEGFWRRGIAANLSGGKTEDRIGQELNLMQDLPEEGRAIARRAFSQGKAFASSEFGSVSQPARDAVGILRTYGLETTDAGASFDEDVENRLWAWYSGATRAERDKWRQAVATIAQEEEQWSPEFIRRAQQRFERTAGKYLANVGGYLSRKGQKIAEAIEDTLPIPSAVGDALEDQRSYFEWKADMWRMLDGDVLRLYSRDAGPVRQGFESFMESIPFMAGFWVNPIGGTGNAMAVIDQQSYNDLRARYPDLPMERIEAIAQNTAAAESLIELAQFGVLKRLGSSFLKSVGGREGVRRILETGGATGLARRGLRGAGALGLATGAEWLQETAQDMLQPIFTRIEEAFGGEIEGFDLGEEMREVREQGWTRFFAVLPMTLIGGLGQAVSRYATSQQIRETMLSWNFMGESGLDRASAEKAMDIARVDPIGAAGFVQRELSALTPDQRQSNRDTVMRDVMREQAERTEAPRVLQTAQGWELMLPGEQTIRSKDLNEIEAAVQDWVLEDASGDMAEIREMLQLQREFSEGASQELLEEVRASRQGGDENIEIVPQEKTSEQGDVSETRRRIAEAQLGLEEGSMGGTVRILGESWVEESQGRAMAMIRLYKGANPLTVIEEGAEGYAKLNAMKDPARRQWLADNLLAAQRDMIERGTIKREFLTEEATKDDEALIESFSEFVTAYVAGNVNEAALSEGFRAWLARFFKLIRDMLRLVKGVQDLREKGLLDEGFEDFIRRAAGMDVDARNAEIEREALRELERQAEAMEYLQGEAEMLLAEEIERRQEVEADLEAEAEWRREMTQSAAMKFDEHPVIEMLRSLGGVLSETEAKKRGKKGVVQGLYDGKPKLNPRETAAVYNPKQGLFPDAAAQSLYDRGMIDSPTPDALWQAIEEARDSGRITYSIAPAFPEVAGFASRARHLTKSERNRLRRDTAERFVEIYDTLPSEKEMAHVALGGIAKRGWYRRSASALIDVFGFDAPRFAGLLAAMSPQTSVESNLRNALNTWKNWVKAGRPTDRTRIVQIMGESVEGSRGEESVLQAWVNNTVRALTAEDVESLVISGPKVNSFMLNLRGVTIEVTNDAWMANFALVDQTIFSGSLTKSGDPGKRAGYLAMSARVRAAAKYLSKLTGEEWTPAEVQETVWSWAKTLYELQERKGENRTALELLRDGELRDEDIAATPDFAILLNDGEYRQILEEAGYAEAVAKLGREHAQDAGGGRPHLAKSEAEQAASEAIRRSQERAAKRLTLLREERLAAKREKTYSISPVTPAQDRAYQQAVQQGDMEAAQRMVDEAAKAAGYTTKAYHGSDRVFNEFNYSRLGERGFAEGVGFYFTDDKSVAQGYSNGGQLVSAWLKLESPLKYDSLGFKGDTLKEILWRAAEREHAYDPEISIDDGFLANFGGLEEAARLVGADSTAADQIAGIVNSGVRPEDVLGAVKDVTGHDSIESKGFVNEGRGGGSIFVVWFPEQIKSADPVTYDDAGNVVPLSERFNENDPRITHSIAPQSPVLTALQERIRRGDEAVVPFFEKMQERVIDIRDRFMARDDGSGELDLRTALAYLGAIQRTLPRELAKVAGTATRLSDFKTLEAMEREIARRIPRIELAFEKFFQKTRRLKVRKLIDKSASKMDKLTRRKSPKVDVVGSAIIDQAVAAMTMSPEEANALADAKRQEADTGDLSAEDQEIRYGEALALELFADYVNASSSRLRSAIEFLETNYEEGREARLEELARRKAEKEERIERMLSSLGTGPVKSYLETAFYDQAPKWFKTLPRELQSFYQVTDMLMENAQTPEDRAVVTEMQNAFRRAAMQFEDRAEEMGEEVEGVIGRLWGFNPKGLRGEASLKALLRDLSTERPNAVTYLEGRKFEEVKVPKAAVDALLRREVNSFEVKGETVELTESDLGELEKAVELFEELPERSQNSRKYITFERMTAAGERTPIGPQSQLDMLKDWLALGQVDAREKYENVGFDETYARELEDALDPQVIELGKWLRDRLKKLTPEVDVAHRREYGLRLASIENYFPLVFQHARNQEEISMDGYDMKRPSQGSWLKARVTHRALPRKANALAVFHAHTQQSLFWLTHAQVIREWGGVLRSMDMQNAVKKRLGVETQQALNKWLNLVEYQGQNQAVLSLGWDRAISNIQSGMSLAVLGGRVRTLLFNANAMFNVLLRVPIGDVLRGFKGLNLADMRKVISSPTFQRRLKSGGSYAAKVALEARSTGGYVPSLLRGAAERGVQPINIVDTLTNLTVAGAYRARLVDLRKQFPSRTDQELEERALDYVDDIMARVAQPVNYLSRSLYENANRRGPAALMFLFASEMRKNFSTLFLAGRKLITGKGEQSKALAAQQAVVILAVYATFTHIMKSLYDAFFRDPDDEEDEFASALDKALDPAAWANSMATEHLRGLPVFGEGASYFIGKAFGQQVYNRSNNPMIRAVEAWQKGERLLEAETVGEAVDLTIDTIQSAASLFPETAVFSQAGNITEEGLGFFRHTFDASLTKADAMERRASRLRKRKKEIAEPTAEEKRKLLDLDDRTRTQNARLKAIDSDRNSQIAGYIQETLAEMALDDRLDYLKFLKEKRLLNEDVARELGYHRELGYSNR